MDLEVSFQKGTGFVLLAANKDAFTFSEKAMAYELALSELKLTIERTANLAHNKKYGAYYWCLTGEVLRPENNTDLLRLYFLAYLIEGKVEEIKYLKLRTRLPKWWIDRINQIGVPIKKASWSLVIYDFLNYGKTFYWLLVVGWKNVSYSLKIRNTSQANILVDINAGPHDNRLDRFSNYEMSNCSFYSGQEHAIKGIEELRIVDFRRELRFEDLLLSLVKLFQIWWSIVKKESTKLDEGLLYYLIRSKSFIKLYDLLLYQKSVSRFFDRIRIKTLIHVSTLTKPTYRALWMEAKKRGCTVVLMSSRTFKETSASDHLISADYKAYNDCEIPDYFVLKDQISFNTLTKDYPELKERCNIGSNVSNDDNLLEDVKELESGGYVFYLILTHLNEPSWLLLRLFKNFLDVSNLAVKEVFVRFHPSCKLDWEKVQELLESFNLVNHTGESMKELASISERKIGFSGPSTGGFELSNYVDLNIWLPFVWSDGYLFHNVNGGNNVLFRNEEDFLSYANKFYELLDQDKTESMDAENKRSYFDILIDIGVL